MNLSVQQLQEIIAAATANSQQNANTKCVSVSKVYTS